jgi:transposase-like protein
MCPHCHNDSKVIKKGYFTTLSRKKVQRFLCHGCGKTFSTQTTDTTYRERKPQVNDTLFNFLCSGISQRRCCRLLGIHQVTVARKIKRLGKHARKRMLPQDVETVVFDEMETFEHTKCKPLSIVVAVDEKTRRVISVKVASMPAKGHLAAISRRKYGPRKDDRRKALTAVLSRIKSNYPNLEALKSDECPRYPLLTKRFFPKIPHQTYKGRRGCVVGQGELKRGGHDPLFPLNHTCAMIRDNIKRLSRRTWCTTKKPDVLQDLLDMYASYHNRIIDHELLSRNN